MREIAAKLNPILLTDEGIRNARQNARSNAAARSGEELLVPIGEVFTAPMSNVIIVLLVVCRIWSDS